MKEQIEKEIEKTKERNEKMLKAYIPPFYEIDYNRGYIDLARLLNMKRSSLESVFSKVRHGDKGHRMYKIVEVIDDE